MTPGAAPPPAAEPDPPVASDAPAGGDERAARRVALAALTAMIGEEVFY